MQKVAARKPTAKPQRRSPSKGRSSVVSVAGHEIRLSNLDKVLYPKTGFTKGEVLEYYAKVAPVLLPHLRERPVTLVRFPNGVDGEHFYEKNCPTYRPPWMETKSVPRGATSGGGMIDFCVLNDEAALLWVVNLAALELHPYLHHRRSIERPTHMVFDFDPGPERSLKDCAQLALTFRDMLAHLGLKCFAKTSGGKGIHMAVPLNTDVTYDDTRTFAQAFAQIMEQKAPKLYTSNMSKAKRGGRIFIDWSQNSIHKTTAGVYSMRAKDEPRVSMPLTWDEVEMISTSRKKQPIDMSPRSVLDRVEEHGDLFAPVLKLEQRLPDLGG